MDLASFGLGFFAGIILGGVAMICVGIFYLEEEAPQDKK